MAEIDLDNTRFTLDTPSAPLKGDRARGRFIPDASWHVGRTKEEISFVTEASSLLLRLARRPFDRALVVIGVFAQGMKEGVRFKRLETGKDLGKPDFDEMLSYLRTQLSA